MRVLEGVARMRSWQVDEVAARANVLMTDVDEEVERL